MIRLVSRSNVVEMFPLMEEGLERARTKTSLGSSWTLENAFDSLVNFAAYGFYQEESGYSGIFTVTSSPQRKFLNIFWAGKDRDNKTPIDEQECDEFFEACAHYFGCNAILVRGRKGWSKLAAKQGYIEDSRTYMKEL